jgi:hypothetical protein
MAGIDTLLGIGLTDEEEMAATAEALRGRKQAADMFGISTVDNIAAAAQQEGGDVMETAKQGGQLVKARQDREARAAEGVLDRGGRLETAIAKAGGGGPLEGTGVEQQMLNFVLDPNADRNSPKWKAAVQRLSREETITTPEGTIVRPGYDIPAMLGEAEAVDAEMIPKADTAQENTAQYTVGNMDMLEESMTDYVPPSAEAFADMLPDAVKGHLTSDEFKNYKNTGDEWASNLVFLRSGATARQEEKDSAFRNYFPQPGDSAKIVADKAQRRSEAVSNAKKAYYKREGKAPPADAVVEDGRTIVRQGTRPDGTRVVEYSDGTVEAASDG